MMRYQIKFSKTEAMRFTGHLDLHTTLERTMRRANLPLVYSEGFTPRPKLSLASALPLGYTSEAEVAEFWLKEDLPIEQVAQAIHQSSPPGIVLQETRTAPPEAPKLQNSLTSAKFRVTLTDAHPDLEKNVRELLSADSLPRVKIRKGKKKTYDLRELVYAIELLPPNDRGQQELMLHLRAEPSATGRPDDVLDALGIDPLTTRIHRTGLIF
jgi:radical SAM-linked protein